MLLQYRLLTRAAPIQSHDRKGVVSATNAQHHAVEDLDVKAVRGIAGEISGGLRLQILAQTVKVVGCL